MEEEIVPVREFTRRFKDLTKGKNRYIISKNGRLHGAYIPYKQWWAIKEQLKKSK